MLLKFGPNINMEKITKDHPLSKSEDILQKNIEMLKGLFPTIVKEGKIDLEELKVLLSDEIEKGDEYYRFTWAGKSEARREANKPSTGTLRPDKESSKNWDKTQNIFIEGDNLEVLKLLQKSYAGKIKMIYIDPPYNTGKDFVYTDNYTDNLNNYLELTGQTDEVGNKLSTNAESDGRYHSNWLNMIYPRLKLARTLLKEDGAIFISIDDNEVQNLRKVCDEIFGEDNFAAQIPWQARQSIQNDTDISESHEYVIVYAKNRRKENRRLKESNKIEWFNERTFAFYPKTLDKDKFANPDNDSRGNWKADPFDAPNIRPNLTYEIKNPITGEKYLPPEGRCWRTTEIEFLKLLEDNRIVFGKSGEGRPQLKVFYEEKKEYGSVVDTWFDGNTYGTATKGTKVMQSLFNGNSPFDTVKPLELIKNISKMAMQKDDIILDYFAGSGTTSHAIMQLNSEDGGKRKCISIQLPAPVEEKSQAAKLGYKVISEITKERIRRAANSIEEELIAKIKKEEKKAPKLELDEDGIENMSPKNILANLDLGFKAYKLDTSNINTWDGNPENLQQTLLNSTSNIKIERAEEDVLVEVLLKFGLDLAVPIEEKTIANCKVYSIGNGVLFVCLADNIYSQVAEGIGKWKEELSPVSCRVLFKDSGFPDDAAKTNSTQILKRYGITEVNSL